MGERCLVWASLGAVAQVLSSPAGPLGDAGGQAAAASAPWGLCRAVPRGLDATWLAPESGLCHRTWDPKWLGLLYWQTSVFGVVEGNSRYTACFLSQQRETAQRIHVLSMAPCPSYGLIWSSNPAFALQGSFAELA